MKHHLLRFAACALTAGAAQAQLVIGFDDTTAGATNCWHIDVATGVSTPLFTQPTEVWGLAADDVGGRLFCNDGSTLYEIPYGTPPLTPVNLGTVTDVVTGATLTFVSLAWANGELYATRNVSNEAVYRIEVDPLSPDYLKASVVAVADYVDADYDFGGFDFNPVDGLFYATNDDTTPFGSGLFSIDVLGTGAINFVTPYPALAGLNDCDGLAIGGNRAYFIEDQVSDIDIYDLATGTFVGALPNPMPTAEVFSGGAWAPGLFGGPSAPVVYCTAGTSTNGCVPAISASAQPSASFANPVTISVANLEGQKSGLIFYGVDNTGFLPLPWSPLSSSFLCVKSPTQRTPAQNSGGTTNACNGVFSLDWNAFQLANPTALGNPFAAGAKVYAQGWYRDPPASKTTNLSDAVELTVVP